MPESILQQLKQLVNHLDDGGCPKPCPPPCSPAPCPGPCAPPGLGCPPCPYPYAQVCMFTPPVCPAPTAPKYVKPLRLPCPPCCPDETARRDPEVEFHTRFSNFYNNYNIDYRETGGKDCGSGAEPRGKSTGCTVDGKSPYCEDYRKKPVDCDEGCPTGFKPCTMRLCPPPCCDPLGVWGATIQPCPPKPKKRVSNKYEPGQCKKPCCKHWKPKDPPCIYDLPCKAHCYDHPIGMKATNF